MKLKAMYPNLDITEVRFSDDMEVKGFGLDVRGILGLGFPFVYKKGGGVSASKEGGLEWKIGKLGKQIRKEGKKIGEA
ncbi:hypothetical protein SLEP1_g27624 [Rubroshorea leprosula]|uniref:Uncharacterized protein n=1 Tax=Rubroshorea leprosula TaxID=152421 RepID=A0AAV5K0P5_9ROSI|nr:hypothetical protein SLEP1_g27624 [Rubroshorea leprosula]